MRAGRRRTSRRLAALGTLAVCLAAAGPLAVAAGPARIAGSWRAGSSCAHPWPAAIYRAKRPNGEFAGDHHHIYMSGAIHDLNWIVQPEKGNVICSARVRLANGRWVGPTRIYPYPTPTPIGGEYKTPSGPHSPMREVIVTAARSPVPPGANCNYPVFTARAVDGGVSEGSDAKDYSVSFKVVHESNPGEPLPTATRTVRLQVVIHNPHVAICHAFLTVFPPNAQGYLRDETAKSLPVGITPNGTVTSPDITVPANWILSAIAYARLKK